MNQIARTPKQIGAVLHRRRRKLRQTQAGLGARTRLRQATISRLEAGEPGTRLGTLMEVLSALNLEMVLRPRTKSSLDEIELLF